MPVSATPVPAPGGVPERPTFLPEAPPMLRNGLIYGCYALLVVAVQGILFMVLDEEGSLLVASPFCLLVLPAFAWLAGWITIGQLTPKSLDSPAHRSPRLGAIICAIPDLLLCAGLAVLFAIDLAQR